MKLKNFRASGNIPPDLVQQAAAVLQTQVENLSLNTALNEGWIFRSRTGEGYCDYPGEWHGLSGAEGDLRFLAFGKTALHFSVEE